MTARRPLLSKSATPLRRRVADEVDGDVQINFAPLLPDAGSYSSRAAQFQSHLEPDRVPYRTICYASVLFVFGLICFVLFTLIAIDWMHPSWTHGMWPMLLIALMPGIAGGYYLGLAVCVLLKCPGWSWSRLPRFN